jgi:hypothetical protein
MKFNDIIRNIVDDYLNAWNGKDVQKIIDIFSENGELESPLIRFIYPGSSQDKVCGKQNLKQSYHLLFNSPVYCKMDQPRIESHDKSITTYVSSSDNKIILKSTFTLNEYGKLQVLNMTRVG